MLLKIGTLYKLNVPVPFWNIGDDPWDQDRNCFLPMGSLVVIIEELKHYFIVRTHLGEFITTIHWHEAFCVEEVTT